MVVGKQTDHQLFDIYFHLVTELLESWRVTAIYMESYFITDR